MDPSATSQAVSTPAVDDAALGSPAVVTDQVQGTDTSTVNDDVSTPTESVEESFTKIDPKSLPPELQAIHKSMLKDYTQKTQEISEYRKKADTYDTLMGNDSFTKLIDLVNNPTPAVPGVAAEPLSGEQLLSEILEKGPGRLDEIVNERLQERLGPLENDIYTEKANKAYQDLIQKYPDLPEHEEAMAEKIRNANYNLSPDDAYMIVTYDKVKQQGINEGAEAVAKRNAAAQPGSSTAVVTPSNRPQSVADAFAQAQATLGWTGNN